MTDAEIALKNSTADANNANYAQQQSGSFSVPNTTDLGTINTSGNLNLPTPPQQNNYAGSLGALVGQQNTLAQNTQTQADTAQNSYNDVLKQLLGYTGDQAQLQQQYDTAGLNQKVRDLQNLQAQQTAQYIQGLNSIELAKNTRQEANAQSVMLNRQHGIDALLTGAQLQSAQGNVEYANNLIKNALDLKYEPIRAQLEYQKEIVSQLNTKAATAQTRALELQLKQIDQQQKEQESIFNLGVTIGKNNAPASIVAKVNAAKNFAEASNIAAPYMVSPADKLDLAIKSLQYTKLKNETANGGLLSIDEAQKLGVPYGTTRQQAIALQGNAKPLSELQSRALNSAKELLARITPEEMVKGNVPVGVSRIGLTMPGTKRADFNVNFNNLTSLLSLDNVKYLKGQGQVSDAERALLANASARLSRSQSPEEFQRNLKDIIGVFEKASPEYQYSQAAAGIITGTNDPYSNYASSAITQQ